MERMKGLLILLFLLAACSGKGRDQDRVRHTDTGTTVPEDVVPESLKPAATDSINRVR